MKDLWVDSNVLLRLVTGDPPHMAAKSLALVRKAEEGRIRLRLAAPVLVEIGWVLSSYYRFPRNRISEVLLQLVSAEGLLVEEKPQVIGAIGLMASHDVDFVDAFLAEKARSSGGAVCSFDRDFDRLGIERIAPG